MKLLTPTQTKDLKAQEVTRDIMRAQELEKAANRLRLNLANAEADFNATLAKNRQIWALEEQEHESRVKERKAEIAGLEAQRQLALTPITELKAQAEVRMEEATRMMNDAILREEGNEILAERLQDRLDGLGQREQDAKRLEATLALKTEGLQRQNESCLENSKRLTTATAEFMAFKQKTEDDLTQRKTDVVLIETSLVAKEDRLKAKALKLDEQEVRIRTARAELDAKRREALIPVATLEAEAARLKALAQSELDDASKLKQEANDLTVKAVKDYDAKLSSLDGRQKFLEDEDVRLANLKAAGDRQAKFIYNSQVALDSEWAKLGGKQAEFKLDLDKFAKAQESFEQSMAVMAIKNKELEEHNTELLNSAQVAQREANAVLATANNKERDLLGLEITIDNQRQNLELAKREAVSAKHEADIAKADLTTRQEGFAVWSRKIEVKIEDDALANNALAKTLADKEKQLRVQEKFLADWSIKLKDERGTLDRAWKELKTK